MNTPPLNTMAMDEFLADLPRRLRTFARRLADGKNISQVAKELRWTPYRKNHATADLADALTRAGFAEGRKRRTGRGTPPKRRFVQSPRGVGSHVLAKNTRLLGGTRHALCWSEAAADES